MVGARAAAREGKGAMERLQHLFWAIALLGVASAVLVAVWLLGPPPLGRRLRWACFAVSLGSLALSTYSAAQMWSVWGSCLLPHPDEVAYHPDMTLCPGQSTSVPLIITTDPITTPAAGRSL